MTPVMLFGLFGGLAMLLYGIRLVGEGLQLAAGGQIRTLLGAVTSNRLKALLAGAGITALIQSSGATTVMLVGSRARASSACPKPSGSSWAPTSGPRSPSSSSPSGSPTTPW